MHAIARAWRQPGDVGPCNACPVKAKCTTSDRGRIVHLSLYADYLEKVRSYHATEAYKKAIRVAFGRLRVITDPAGDRGTGELDPE